MKDDNYLEHLRHSTSHLLAAAVIELWPNAKLAIGPAIENGFYYDIDFGNTKVNEEDFPKIEKKMHELIGSWKSFHRLSFKASDAKKQYKDNPYKNELIEEFSYKGKKEVGFYESVGSKSTYFKGETYRDLCKGGHTEKPSEEIKYFKLLSIAGAYWRGDEKNKMLTRIYGTVWPTQKELDEYLKLQEEAKKRDHRKLGRELNLFLFSPSVGPGLPLFTPKGTTIRHELEKYLTDIKKKWGLQFVWTPHIARSELYKQSKHWQKYDAMMPPFKVEDDEYVLKPMNCPHHFQIYNSQPRSYKDLPIRYAENATDYRYEKSGELNGLLRVRALTQDDSHWFVPHDKLGEELQSALDLMVKIFDDFGLKNYNANISVRDKSNLDKYIGEPEVWDKAEKQLVDAVEKRGIKYKIDEGEAAFYGPKIDIKIEDAIGRQWQLTTVQLDFNQPNNFNLEYTDTDGSKQKAAVLHIAIVGSIERFMAILIEHFEGNFPTWLTPVQVKVLPITDKHVEYAKTVVEKLMAENIRAELDDRNERLQAKIRDAQLEKVAYMFIVGDKEAESNKVAVRKRDGTDLGAIDLESFINDLKKEIEKKRIN